VGDRARLGRRDPVPKIPSYRITELAQAIGPDCRHDVVGVRPGEKLHEEMITASDSLNTVDRGEYYAILPNSAEYSIEDYCAKTGATRVEPGFSYDSGRNPNFLDVEQLRRLIGEHVAVQ
jgi:FlaA1/EpsC-like NDP-sugar epimerase